MNMEKNTVVRVYSAEELKNEFEMDGDVLILGPGSRDSISYYRVDIHAQEAVKEAVRSFEHPCAVTVEKDGREYWLVDTPTGAGPGSTVVLLFNVEYGRPLDTGAFRVATWNCGRGALTDYCYDQWFVEKSGSVMPRRYDYRTIDDIF